MFCGKCGTEIPEIAKFCPKCGAPVDRAAESISTPVARPATGTKKTGLIVGVALAVIIVVASSIWGLTSLFSQPEDAETVAIKYVDASFDLDYSGMNRYMAVPYDKAIEDMLKITDATIKYYEEEGTGQAVIDRLKEAQEKLSDEKAKKLLEQIRKLLSESRKETFGKDYKRSVEVLYQTELSDSERSEFLQRFKSNFDSLNSNVMDPDAKMKVSNYFPLNKVNAIYEVACEVTEEGSENIHTTQVEFTLLEINGKYKAFDGMFGGGDSILNYVNTYGMDTSTLDENFAGMEGLFGIW